MAAISLGVSNRVQPTLLSDADYAELCARAYPALRRYCRRLLAAIEDADDVAQEAIVRAWEARSRYSPTRPFWPWVRVIAQRVSIDHHRRATAGVVALRKCALKSVQPDTHLPDQCAEKREEQRLALAAFRALGSREQRLIYLRDVAGWSYGQIAESEHLTLDAVRASLHRTHKRLRREYEMQLEAPARAS